MGKIATFLWFDTQAEEAARFYTSVFENAEITDVQRMDDGTVTGVSFEIDGQRFIGFNGGPPFTFTAAISLYVHCETQAEVDAYWDKLTADGGEPSQCGWLKDKYGLSWQVIPDTLPRLLGDPDPAKSQRVMEAMLKMGKIDLELLTDAHAEA